MIHWLWLNCTGNWVAGVSQDAIMFGLGWIFSKKHRSRLRAHRAETMSHLREQSLLITQIHKKVHDSGS